MSDREVIVARFLAATPAAGWQHEPMAGDASARHFVRLAGPDGQSAILMVSDKDDLSRFSRLARHLRDGGLAAPGLLALDLESGLALVEDLGRDHAAAWLESRPDDAETLYSAAVDVLHRLHHMAPPTGLANLGPLRAAAMISPLFEFYCPAPDARWRAHVTGLLQEALMRHAPVANTLALRDFHAENIVWRADRAGLDRVGLVDFQDAVCAAPEYDLVSLLRDARRDVPPALRGAMLDRFSHLTGRPPDQVRDAAAVIGVQRNLRILGIFARLARRDGKPRYLDLLPRVWGMVMDDLDHAPLATLAAVLQSALPPPDAAHIARLAS